MKFIGAGLATLSMFGTGIGIGLIFSALISSISRNPQFSNLYFSNAIIGFALTEAIALFGLMIAFLMLFAF
jgi:F0F1-type ATP synthase membrane subunit c/vacuolar-type H+-ATPase subunit K